MVYGMNQDHFRKLIAKSRYKLLDGNNFAIPASIVRYRCTRFYLDTNAFISFLDRS